MKQFQKGAISPALIVLGVILALGALTVMSGIGLYMSAANTGADYDTRVKYAYRDNEQTLGQYGQKISEAAQIPAMQTEDLAKLFTGSLGARYGKDGSQAAMQWIKEQNPNIDQRTYMKLMQLIEAGRNEFQNKQTKLMDVCRSYEYLRNKPWDGMWIRFAGFPKDAVMLEKMCTPISTDRAQQAYANGKESSPIKLR